MELQINCDQIKQKVVSGKPLVYTVHKVSKDVTNFFVDLIEIILGIMKKNFLYDPLAYILREFISNANKSNLKRIHFKKLGLDINNKHDYVDGMETFAKEFRLKFDEYSSQLEEEGLFIKVIFLVKDEFLIISITNSSTPTSEEYERITKRIKNARFIRNTAEAYTMMEDSSEGAGIGTVSSIVMLRNMGVSENAYNFMVDRERNLTTVKVFLPLNTVTMRQSLEISKVIAKEINSIPPFPEKVVQIQQMIKDQDVAFSKVALAVQRDPALSAELLKIVNSAQYMLPHRVSNLNNAISLIGLKGLQSLLYSYGTQSTLGKNSGTLDQLWQHSFRCASYSYYIAKECNRPDVMDDVYVGGLLHDIGKIIVTNFNPSLLKHIQSYCQRMGLSKDFLENLAMGTSHANIGAEITRNWNFPEHIITQIEFHHQPLLAPDDLKFVVGVVYLANMMTHMEDEDFTFSEIEPLILEYVRINSLDTLLEFKTRIDAYYQKQQERE